MILTCLAGYTAPALIGLGVAALVDRGHASFMIGLLVVLLLGMLIKIRNLFGFFVVIVCLGGLGAVFWLANPEVHGLIGELIAWFLLIGSIRPVFELQTQRHRGLANHSDADQLASLTRIPGLFWVIVFMIITVGSALVGGNWLVH
jgi:hypothetical protein